MRFRCGLCMVSPSSDGFESDRETVRKHLHDHNIPEESIETYLSPVRGEQSTLITATDGGSTADKSSTDTNREETNG